MRFDALGRRLLRMNSVESVVVQPVRYVLYRESLRECRAGCFGLVLHSGKCGRVSATISAIMMSAEVCSTMGTTLSSRLCSQYNL